MVGGLQKVKCRSTGAARQNKRWFTKDLLALRMCFHQSKRVWLREKDRDIRKIKRKIILVVEEFMRMQSQVPRGGFFNPNDKL